MSLPITTIPSPNFTRGRARNVRLIVIHTVEAPERGTIAEDVARNWFATTAARSSAHYVVDSDSIVRCVDEASTAWAAPGANADGIQIEHAGYAAQNPGQWGDDYSRAMLELSARLTADLCKRYGIPARRLSVAELRNGARGIIGHIDATNAFSGGRGHTDPGPSFPWDTYLAKVRGYLGQAASVAPSNAFPLPAGHFYGPNDGTARSHSGARVADRAQIKRIQAKVGVTADGLFGARTASAVAQWQRKNKLAADQKVGPATWKAMSL